MIGALAAAGVCAALWVVVVTATHLGWTPRIEVCSAVRRKDLDDIATGCLGPFVTGGMLSLPVPSLD